MTLHRIRPATLNTDAAFCEKVCRIAGEEGWRLDLMETFIGTSAAFEHRDGRRIAGDIFKSKQDALVHACKALLPEIYLHL